MTTDSHHPSDNMTTDNPEDKQRAFGAAPVPTPADSPADPSLDEILQKYAVQYRAWMNIDTDDMPDLTGAKAALELWKQRAVVAELEILADRMQRQVDFPTIFPELKGLEHGQRMAKFGWMQAGREINDRIQRLTARPDTEGDKDE